MFCALFALGAWSAHGAELAAETEAATITGTVSLDKAPGKTPLMVVYVDGDGPEPDEPGREVINQLNQQFTPGAIVVMAGATVEFPNKDTTWHNAYSATDGNEFDFGQYRRGARPETQLDAPGQTMVLCGEHPNMMAKILVVPNAWYAVADPATGKFQIDGVAPGKRTLIAWTPKHVQVEQEITVEAGGRVVAGFELERAPGELRPPDPTGPYTK